MDVKGLIQEIVIASEEEIKSECFCKMALKGGYENHVRDMIFLGLRVKVKDVVIEKENPKPNEKKNRIDIFSSKFLIELGHNGTWQRKKMSVNHAEQDFIRATDYGLLNDRDFYTISIITDVLDFNKDEDFRLRKSYLGGIKSEIRKGNNKINDIKNLFLEIDKNMIVESFISEWNGFRLKIYFIICKHQSAD